MNDIQIFNNPEFGQIRTIEQDGIVLFCAKDVATALGYKDTNSAIKQHCRGVAFHHPTQDNLGRIQNTRFITEGDTYRLIASSKLEGAQRFESWTFDQVLPSIRKHGAYATPQTIENIIADPRNGIKLLEALAAEQDKNKALQAENAAMQPKAFFADAVTQSKTSVLIGVLAKLLRQNGYETGQNRLFKTLCNDGYLIGTKGRNYHMPTQRAADMGLFEVKESAHTHSDGYTSIDRTTLVTGKGQVYFINRYCGQVMAHA